MVENSNKNKTIIGVIVGVILLIAGIGIGIGVHKGGGGEEWSNLCLRFYLDDALVIHQLQAPISRAYATACHDLQIPQHYHRRPLLLHHHDADHAQD